jgi:3-carboxy-cis,cis-muconate cycloisomerase
MAAAPKLGRQRAHDRVYEACRQALDGGGDLAEILCGMGDVSDALGGIAAVRRHCDPMNYVGLAPQMVDRVLARPALD